MASQNRSRKPPPKPAPAKDPPKPPSNPAPNTISGTLRPRLERGRGPFAQRACPHRVCLPPPKLGHTGAAAIARPLPIFSRFFPRSLAVFLVLSQSCRACWTAWSPGCTPTLPPPASAPVAHPSFTSFSFRSGLVTRLASQAATAAPFSLAWCRCRCVPALQVGFASEFTKGVNCFFVCWELLAVTRSHCVASAPKCLCRCAASARFSQR